MEELDFYNGTHSGQEVDAATEKALNPRVATPIGSADDFTDSTLAGVAVVAISLNQEIVQFIGTLTMYGEISYLWTWSTPSPSTPTDVNITAQHVPVRVEFSDPTVICGNYDLTIGNNSVAFTGAGYGSTEIKITLARQLGSAIDKR